MYYPYRPEYVLYGIGTMAQTKTYFEDLLHFIRENRSNESHFETLREKLTAACKDATDNPADENSYVSKLQEALEKHAPAYKQKKENGISAWPEFENFVTHFEKAVTEALHEA
jgi:hypothetical protein